MANICRKKVRQIRTVAKERLRKRLGTLTQSALTVALQEALGVFPALDDQLSLD
jgi:mRNA-degrading endonuclease toxin of MazEF toxin-antitoxin module